MIMFVLGRRTECVNEHWVILFAEIRLKLPVILREMLEGEQILTNFGMSWSEFWLRLEEIESLMAYWDRMSLGSLVGQTTGTHTTNNTQLLVIVRLPVAARKELGTVY